MAHLTKFINGLMWISKFILLGYILFTLLHNSGLLPVTNSKTLLEINEMIEKNSTYFKYVTINEYSNEAYFYKNSTYTYKVPISKHDDFGNKISNYSLPVYYTHGKSIVNYATDLIFYWLIFQIVTFFLGRYLSNNLSISSIVNDKTNSIFNLVKPDDITINFEDVIGQKEGKIDMLDCVKYFNHREKYLKTGYEIPKGLLLVGDPGTGKTLLAKAFANEAKINFISACGSDFIEMFVGVGSKRVRELFELARKNSPCVIFIDEIDAIGSKRNGSSSGHNEHGSTLNKLLSEMDGFNPNDNIMVIAATNRVETLDKALIRSGRFDKQIYFDPPNLDERKELFKLFTNKIKLDPTFKTDIDDNVNALARATAGLTGADIKNICNQAIRLFMNRIDLETGDFNDSGVIYDDLTKSIDVVMIGMEKPERKMTDKEREIVSYHEAGHSLIAYMLKDTEPPIKVSIIPRGRSALGFSQQEPSDRKIITKNELFSRLCVLMGGRMAEKIIYDHYSTGAADDIEKATQLAFTMVSTYGMDDNIGPINSLKINNNSGKYISDKTKELIDMEVNNLIKKAQDLTRNHLNNHKNELIDIAKFLLEKEVLLSEDMDNILAKYNIKNKL